MFEFSLKDNFVNLIKKLTRLKSEEHLKILKSCAEDGVSALQKATPYDTGLTSSSWYYKIEESGNVTTIKWCNSNVNDGVPIAIILQYGHGTGTGGYVKGVDYINPAMKPVFDDIKNRIRKEALKL